MKIVRDVEERSVSGAELGPDLAQDGAEGCRAKGAESLGIGRLDRGDLRRSHDGGGRLSTEDRSSLPSGGKGWRLMTRPCLRFCQYPCGGVGTSMALQRFRSPLSERPKRLHKLKRGSDHTNS